MNHKNVSILAALALAQLGQAVAASPRGGVIETDPGWIAQQAAREKAERENRAKHPSRKKRLRGRKP